VTHTGERREVLREFGGEIERKRPSGRRHRWEYNVKMYL
jgi:hypothetical protein